MAYESDDWKPQKKSRMILARAWEWVQSVPYQVTSRWVFYGLLQEGYYHVVQKGDKRKEYNKFLSLTSRARHHNWQGWRPDTLTDDTRQTYEHVRGFATTEKWVEWLLEQELRARLDHWHKQRYYAECWFEAAAMYRQFEHYTAGITLRPFQGMPSIDYKYRAAKSLEADAKRYGLPVVILYFGDYDDAGLIIPETSVNDVRKWCGVDFEFVRCGLNKGDGERLGIQENFEKPGHYQWEALRNEAARDIITSNVARFVDMDIVKETEQEAKEAGEKLAVYLQDFEA